MQNPIIINTNLKFMNFINTLKDMMEKPPQNTETKKKEPIIYTTNEKPVSDAGFLAQFEIL
jgi:hypothetical protein